MAADTTADSPFPRRTAHAAGDSRGARWTGRVLSALALAFLAMDATIKLLRSSQAVAGTVALGYPEGVLVELGAIQLACWILYAVPRTAVLGALLWTGYLGGAVATQLRVGNPLLTHVLFPVYVAALLWGGLWLRDGRVRQLRAPPPTADRSARQ